MPAMKAEFCLVLNGKVVPVEKVNMPWMDPFGLAPDSLDEDQPLEVSLVDIKSTGDIHWICSSLEVTQRWWRSFQQKVPLLMEILELIKSKRIYKGAASRAPKQHKSLLPLQIRNKTMWFANNARFVCLALLQGQEVQMLQWFMDELYQDVEDLVSQSPPLEQPDAPQDKHQLEENLQAIADQAVQTLQEHHSCLLVHYMPSRNSLKVVRKGDKASKEHRLKNLNRKLKEIQEQDNQEALQNLFDIAVSDCINFLDNQDKQAAAPAADPEVPEPAEGSSSTF